MLVGDVDKKIQHAALYAQNMITYCSVVLFVTCL